MGIVDGLAAGLLMLQALLRIPVVLDSFFWQQDLARLTAARSGLVVGTALVQSDGTGPMAAVVTWFVSRLGSWTFVRAGLLLLVIEALAGAVAWLVLRRLYGTRPVVLVPFAFLVLTPASVASVGWLTGGLLVVLPQLWLALGALGLVGFASARGETRTWWAVLTVLAHAGAVLTGATGLLFLPALVLLRVSLGLSRARDRVRLGSRGAAAAFWMPQMVVGLVGYAVLLPTLEPGPVAWSTWWRVFVPSLIGAPFSAADATETAYPGLAAPWTWGVTALLALLVLGTVRTGRLPALAAWGAAALLVAGAGLVAAFWLAMTGAAFAGAQLSVALPLAVVMVSAAFAPPGRRPSTAAGVRAGPHSLTPLLLLAAVIVATGVSVMNVVLGGAFAHGEARDFAQRLHAGLQVQGGRSIRNAPLPVTTARDTELSVLFSAMGERPVLDQPSDRLWVVNQAGTVVEGRLRNATISRGPRRNCGWLLDRSATGVLGTLGEAEHTLRLDYYSGYDGLLTLTYADRIQSMSVDSRLGSTFFVLPRGGGEVSLSFEESDGPMCLVRIVEGEPWPGG